MFGIPLCSVYCNTLLANLNVRVYCRDKMMEHSVDLQASEDCKTEKQSGEVTELVQMEHHRDATSLVANPPKQSENVYA
ncbi:hypothetical protein JVT61DRAFT_13822 [Boletus reticuloceps]|uniref:Uncharacterized protein n=1 Tax=Boletus reticuloceps TaxID=495285 RepID=A0A8I2YU94_9AGAM|nr:hypothetical protein JVT61DRAFT_13822 [Boletus reticuloceps]